MPISDHIHPCNIYSPVEKHWCIVDPNSGLSEIVLIITVNLHVINLRFAVYLLFIPSRRFFHFAFTSPNLWSEGEADSIFVLLARFSSTSITFVTIIYSITRDTFTTMGILWSGFLLFLSFLCFLCCLFFSCLFQFLLFVLDC